MAAPLSHFAPKCILFIILIIIFSPTGSGSVEIYANPGDSVKIAVNETCITSEELTLIRSHSTIEVAKRVNGFWLGKGTASGRIAHDSASSVILKDVNYNDGGHYEFKCGGGYLQYPILLKLAVPFDKGVHEGAGITLPCHHAVSERVQRVRWEKDGEPVLEQDRSRSGEKGKASVPEDWHSKGNLSLTLERVQPEDEGNYVCYLVHDDGTRERGDPSNVRLAVYRRGSKLIDSTTPMPEHEGGSNLKISPELITCIVIIVVLLCSLAGAIACIVRLKTRSRDGARPAAGPAENAVEVNMNLIGNHTAGGGLRALTCV